MDIRILTSSADFRIYDAWIKRHPEGTLWQSLEWKTYQEALGRDVRIYAAMEGPDIQASALVVIDRTTFGLSTWEIPRGPLLSEKLQVNSEQLLEKLVDDAQHDRCISLYLSPPNKKLFTIHSSLFTSRRFVMPEATRIINLTLSEEDLLGQMRPKGRYNIKLAEKHGISVGKSDDVEAYTALAKETWIRDGFRGPKRGYEAFLKNLPGSFLLLATHEKRPLAGLLGVVWKSTGIYYYGASSAAHREMMAPYLLQWEAMKYCREKGCSSYDLFGIAPDGALNHPWSGVSDFKAKFGGSIVTYPPEQEMTLRPIMKAILGLKRRLLK